MREQLQKYVDAGFPIIYIRSFEEVKIDAIIRDVMKERRGLEWNGATGLCDFKTKAAIMDGMSLEDALLSMVSDEGLKHRFLVLKDAHSFFEEPKIIACLKALSLKIAYGFEATIIIVSPILKFPPELEKFITILELPYPTQKEIKEQIKEFVKAQGSSISDNLLETLSMTFKGLTEFEIDNLLALAYADDGSISANDTNLIIEQKRQMIMKSGILEMIPLKEKAEDIGGLENLKIWLKRKSKVFHEINKAIDYGVNMPKGVMIAGVPGCGKSLCAKVTANLFEVPLLRLDMGKIMGQYVGQSEENMRRAIALAEAISPCVLWIDELEKAFAGVNNGGHEVTVRLFGTFLTWMQEKTSSTFVVATANDITQLPPELMRKGRFDEIFYVGLPNPSERQKIFEIHIGKRRKENLTSINIDSLVRKTDGYSGADIEGVIIEAVETSFVSDAGSLTTQHIETAINNTHSLSEIMKDSLNSLSKVYEERHFKSASR